MKRILFLSHNIPYPPHAGVTHRTYNVLRELAREFEIDVVAFHRRAYHPDPGDVRSAVHNLAPYCEVRHHPLPGSYSRLEFAFRHLRSLISGRAYVIDQYRSHEYRRSIDTLLRAQEYGLVHLDSIVLAGYAGQLGGMPKACTHHNVESDLLRQSSTSARPAAKRPYMRLQAERLRKLERRWCPRFDLNIAVSERDRKRLQRSSPEARFQVVPNGVDCAHFHPRGELERSDEIAFVGGMTWSPNWDGIRFFLDRIWPRLLRTDPQARLSIIGKCSPGQRSTMEAHPRVRVLGYVDDIRPHLWRAGCVVIPIRVGGGTRIKILDAWALGKAVVSTPTGCEGLMADDGGNILIRSDPADFAEAVSRVLRDGHLRRGLGRAGRSTVEETYDWKVLGRRLRELYAELTENAAPAIARS